jgi:hypothetical protein
MSFIDGLGFLAMHKRNDNEALIAGLRGIYSFDGIEIDTLFDCMCEISSIEKSNDSTWFASGYEGSFNYRIWKSNDDGETWEKLIANNPPLGNLYSKSEDSLFIAYGSVHYSVDGGINWIQGSLGSINSDYAKDVVFFNGTTGIFVGGDENLGWGPYRRIYETTDGGNTWQVQISSDEKPLTSVVCLYDSTCLACGWDGTIMITNNGGGVGISDYRYKNEFLIYPNPISETSIIRLPKNVLSHVVFSIYNSKGTLVSRKLNSATEKIKLNRNNLKPGIYLVKIQSDEFQGSTKIIVK